MVGTFRNLEDPNLKLEGALATDATPRLDATTRRMVNEAVSEERPQLRIRRVLSARRCSERRVSRQDKASPGGRP